MLCDKSHTGGHCHRIAHGGPHGRCHLWGNSVAYLASDGGPIALELKILGKSLNHRRLPRGDGTVAIWMGVLTSGETVESAGDRARETEPIKSPIDI